MASKYIKVKTRDNNGRVILFERHSSHPVVDGVNEAFIYANDKKVFEVGETPQVATLLAHGVLEKAK